MYLEIQNIFTKRINSMWYTYIKKVSVFMCMFLKPIDNFWLISKKLHLQTFQNTGKINGYLKKNFQIIFYPFFQLPDIVYLSTNLFFILSNAIFSFLLQYLKQWCKNFFKKVITHVLCFYKIMKIETHSLYFKIRN